MLLFRNLSYNLFRGHRPQKWGFSPPTPQFFQRLTWSTIIPSSSLLTSWSAVYKSHYLCVLMLLLLLVYQYFSSETKKPLLWCWFGSLALPAELQWSSAQRAHLPWLYTQVHCPWAFRKSLRTELRTKYWHVCYKCYTVLMQLASFISMNSSFENWF